MPTGPSASLAVTTVTPVAKCPITSRKRCGSTVAHQPTVSVPYMPSSSWLASTQYIA